MYENKPMNSITRPTLATAITAAITTFLDEATNTLSHVVRDQIIAFITEHKLQLEWILETHVHADHLSAAPYIQQRLGGRMAIGSNIPVVQETFGRVFNAGADISSLISWKLPA